MSMKMTNIEQNGYDNAVNDAVTAFVGISFAHALTEITQEINALMKCFYSYDMSKQWPAVAIREQYKVNPGQAVVLHELVNLHSRNLTAIAKQIDEEFGNLEITEADRAWAAGHLDAINKAENEHFGERITPKTIEAFCELLNQRDMKGE